MTERQHGSDALLERLDYTPVDQVTPRVEAPFNDCTTSKASDIERVVGHIQQQLCDGNGCKIVLLGGDQQSFIGVLRLKQREPAKFENVIPFPGDWHLLVHMLIQINKDWWDGIARFAHEVAGITPFLQPAKAFEVAEYQMFKTLYDTVTKAALEYLFAVVPPALLMKPERLLTLLGTNKGETTLRSPKMNSFSNPKLETKN